MNHIEKIAYIRELETKKEKVQKEIISINHLLEKYREDCNHISVDLGYFGHHISIPNMQCYCLFCSKKLSEKDALESQYIVHAEDYLLMYDTNDEQQCKQKLDQIQTLAIGLLRENPNMSEEELTNKLNGLIQLAIAIRTQNSLDKGYQKKKK